MYIYNMVRDESSALKLTQVGESGSSYSPTTVQVLGSAWHLRVKGGTEFPRCGAVVRGNTN